MPWAQYGENKSLSLINVNNWFVSATRGWYIMLVLPTSVDDLDMLESNLFCDNEEVYLKLPKEPEHPLVLLSAYCEYLVQVESLTMVV